ASNDTTCTRSDPEVSAAIVPPHSVGHHGTAGRPFRQSYPKTGRPSQACKCAGTRSPEIRETLEGRVTELDCLSGGRRAQTSRVRGFQVQAPTPLVFGLIILAACCSAGRMIGAGGRRGAAVAAHSHKRRWRGALV